MASPAALRWGLDAYTSRRFTVSAHAIDSPLLPTAEFQRWFDEHRRANQFTVNRIPFDELVGWRFEDGTGNLVHESGRFFSIEGLDVGTDWGDRSTWMQPIINQPEIGILGIIVKEFDGILHCLMQAKMEPGNLNSVQLSPTVQATRSNYTGVHRGRGITYLEYFLPPRRSEVLIDSLQSEQGAWFLHKRNRNMVVEVTEDITLHEDFCWLTIGQIHQLLLQDNLVNMDSRTVLACIPFDAPNGGPRGAARGPYRESLLRSFSAGQQQSLHSTGEILSWLTDAKSRHELIQRTVPLREVKHWYRTPDEIGHEMGKYFRVIAADVSASNREVTRWTQPLLAPVEQGRVAFLARPVNGVLHLLMQAKTEAGVFDFTELAPTVQCMPGNTEDLPVQRRPRYLDVLLGTDPAGIRYDVVQSEEGGRFYHADNRYQIVEVGEDFPLDVPDEYRWMTVRQVTELLQHSNYVNIQARSLLAGVHTTW
jgi:dTDP-4-dehydro-6-deoxy-alpha-D-glucopyranose 2,3-dehydratase